MGDTIGAAPPELYSVAGDMYDSGRSEVTRSGDSSTLRKKDASVTGMTYSPDSASRELPCGVPSNARSARESVWESHESTSGYVAQDDKKCQQSHSPQTLYHRLHRFYELYNPSKLGRIEEYLQAYRGEEEQLFAILVGKYGPEPPPDGLEDAPAAIPSSEEESLLHYSGKRCQFPKSVSPMEGNTDCETPYWAGSFLISDRDILSLFHSFETPNVELQKCFVGLLDQHPSESWNGMTFATHNEDVARAGEVFLGHIWAGTLGSGKILVHQSIKYQRFTLYCTEECQRQGSHERWRLSVYRKEGTTLAFLRTLWDPVVIPEPLPQTRSNPSEHEFHSSSEAVPTRLSSASSLHSGSRKQPLQPEQSKILTTLTNFSEILQGMESRIVFRLQALEDRIAALEDKKEGK